MIELKQSINNEDETFVTGLSNDSRLHMFNAIKDDKSNYYFNIFKNHTIPDIILNNPDYYNTYIIDNDDWWDNISAHWYKTSELWWLVCFTNNIINPYEDIYPGMIIKILKKEYYGDVMQKLKEISKL